MKKTVMVVDDEEDIRTTLKSVLQGNGFKVITAVNGDDCLVKLKKTNKPTKNSAHKNTRIAMVNAARS